MLEIDAMKTVAEALSGLDPDGVGRVLRWAADHFGIEAVAVRRPGPSPGGAAADSGLDPSKAFAELADLYAAASPATDADRALVAGYWYQFAEGDADFQAQRVNSALKQLGHGVSNITSAFDTLKARRPQLVMQVRKAGTTKQARKRYKLTAEGQKAVELMVSTD
jgi:hypothetical protein